MFTLITVAVLATLATAGLVHVGVLSSVSVAVVALLGLIVVLLERTHRQASGPARSTHARNDRDIARTLNELHALEGLARGRSVPPPGAAHPVSAEGRRAPARGPRGLHLSRPDG